MPHKSRGSSSKSRALLITPCQSRLKTALADPLTGSLTWDKHKHQQDSDFGHLTVSSPSAEDSAWHLGEIVPAPKTEMTVPELIE